jgi:hypothetical protein
MSEIAALTAKVMALEQAMYKARLNLKVTAADILATHQNLALIN